jgi:hypothetical protein
LSRQGQGRFLYQDSISDKPGWYRVETPLTPAITGGGQGRFYIYAAG